MYQHAPRLERQTRASHASSVVTTWLRNDLYSLTGQSEPECDRGLKVAGKNSERASNDEGLILNGRRFVAAGVALSVGPIPVTRKERAAKRDDRSTERLMTLKEVARYLGKSERWARMEGRELGLPLVVIGRSLRCDPADLKKWVHQQR